MEDIIKLNSLSFPVLNAIEDLIQSEIEKLTEISNTPDLWDNPEYARGILQKKSNLEKQINELQHQHEKDEIVTALKKEI